MLALAFASPAHAMPSAFARQHGFLPGDLVPDVAIGALVRIDTLEGEPTRLQPICSASEMQTIGRARVRSMPHHGERAGLGEHPLNELAGFLEDVNFLAGDDILVALDLEINFPEIYELPAEVLPDSLNDLPQRCLVTISQAISNHARSRRNLVLINAALVADVNVRAIWSRQHRNLAGRISVMGLLGDHMGLNGGQCGENFVRAPLQQIGWKHDGGAWLEGAVLR